MKKSSEHQKRSMKTWYQRNRQKKLEYQKKYRANNPDYVIRDRERAKKLSAEARKDPNFRHQKKLYDLKKLYGLTEEQYNNLRKKQDYSCAVCYEKETPEKQLHVDHSHVTNEVRGLLCQKCNTSLGIMLDSPILIGRLMGYVKTHDDYALKTVKYLKTSIGVSNKVKQIRNEKKIKIDRNTIKLTNDFFTDFIKECKKVLKSKEPKGTLEDFI